ncbi:MAG: type II secretion system protein [Candidatus Saccharimonadales bacterium]
MVPKRSAGFTLLEMILVMGIITIIMAVSVPLYASLSNRNQLQVSVSLLAQDLYQAQANSRAQLNDSAWGVAFNGQTITLFQGNSYASRSSSQDVNYVVPSAIKMSGDSQVVYSRLYGLPTATANFSLSGAGQTMPLAVNSKGMVEY